MTDFASVAGPQGIRGFFEYNRDLFDRTTTVRLLGHDSSASVLLTQNRTAAETEQALAGFVAEVPGTEIPIVEMFNHPSLSHLARRLASIAKAPDPDAGQSEPLLAGKDWRRQRLEKLRAMEGL